MNIDRLKLWLEDIESSNAEQGRNRLHNSDGTYCCLGRLCVVARANGLDLNEQFVPHRDDGEVDCYEYNGQRHYAPRAVIEWLDVEWFSDDGLENIPQGDVIALTMPVGLYTKDSAKPIVTGSQLNDAGCTFAQIADCLRWEYGL